jgi:hypothetical protein
MNENRKIFQFRRVDNIERTLDITVHAYNLKEAQESVKVDINWENCVESETVTKGALKLTYEGKQ